MEYTTIGIVFHELSHRVTRPGYCTAHGGFLGESTDVTLPFAEMLRTIVELWGEDMPVRWRVRGWDVVDEGGNVVLKFVDIEDMIS